jgi:hypothetical protein
MKRIGRYVVLFTLVCLFVLSNSALASGFSADLITVSGNEKMEGKVLVGKEKMRFEADEMITITRMDKQVVWMLMPGEKMYMEQRLSKGNVVPSKEPAQGELERIHLGTEMVSGKSADKYRITVNTNGQKESFFQWIAKDSGFPVKMAAIDGSWWQEYRNLVIGEPPSGVFEIPAGYQKIDMPF